MGDASHCTFFEMLGNWSLGDYFKKEAISWSWEFLTSPEWLGLDPDKLAFTVFAGDDKAPRDDEAAGYWKANGVKDDHIFYLNAKHNWWGPAGITGPCGPDTEMFVIKDQPPCGPNCSPACDCGRYLEIWNDVFMQYNKQADGSFPPLEKKNVDTGMGLERTIGVLLGAKSVYETDLFSGIIARIEELSGKKYNPDDEYARSFRVVADHLRTSTIIIGDDRGVTPSNVDQGYVLRRLIRRSVRHGMKLEMPEGMTAEIAKVVVEQYKDVYPELKRNEAHIIEQLLLEEERFQKTLKQGMKEFDKLLFNGYSTISLGYAGLYECVKYMTGKSHTDPAATPFALSIMQKMNDKCAEWKKAENIDYSLYGTPLESTTYKFAKCLQRRFGIIEGITDKGYITNSYHVNVTEEINAFEKLKFEAQFQHLSPGGAISYVEVPDMQNNIPAVLEVMKFIYNNIIYAELNTKSDYCQVCGWDGEIQIVEDNGKLIWKCPKCGNTDQDKMNVARRTCGYIGTQFWNQGRTQEIRDRVLHL